MFGALYFDGVLMFVLDVPQNSLKNVGILEIQIRWQLILNLLTKLLSISALPQTVFITSTILGFLRILTLVKDFWEVLFCSGMSKLSQICEATFSYVHCVTILCTTCVEGTECIPMFFIRGKDIPYRIIDKNNRWEHEPIHDCLPTGSLVTTREDTTSVDRHNFAAFATCFVDCFK